jgi:hypothetical protein
MQCRHFFAKHVWIYIEMFFAKQTKNLTIQYILQIFAWNSFVNEVGVKNPLQDQFSTMKLNRLKTIAQ